MEDKNKKILRFLKSDSFKETLGCIGFLTLYVAVLLWRTWPWIFDSEKFNYSNLFCEMFLSVFILVFGYVIICGIGYLIFLATKDIIKSKVAIFVIILLLGSNSYFIYEKYYKNSEISSEKYLQPNQLMTKSQYVEYFNRNSDEEKVEGSLSSIKSATKPYNSDIVFISTSPNAYAYHRTFDCAKNRTKYSVKSVTRTEALDKYYRSPCNICHPR